MTGGDPKVTGIYYYDDEYSHGVFPPGTTKCSGPVPGGNVIYWTADNAATKQYDSYKVQAVVNWINGHEHSGQGRKVGTPAIYGMNFQTVSTAEKLKTSPAALIGPDAQGKYTEGPSLPGGYMTVHGQQVPGPLLRSALGYVNKALQRMADTIQADGQAGSTAIVLTAKHGQSPQNKASCSGSMTPRSSPASTRPGPDCTPATRR
jgi:hypothetical protein